MDWESVAHLVAARRDVIDARPEPGLVPEVLVRLGWAEALLGLEDPQLDELEIDPTCATWGALFPSSLAELGEQLRALRVPALPARPLDAQRPLRRRETDRKRSQVEALANAIEAPAAAAARVVDVGAGHGHLARELAARLPIPVVGLDRDARFVERARALSTSRRDYADARAFDPVFVVVDVLREGLDLKSSDFVVALHACGELGDAIVAAATEARASVAIVSCCLQKIRAPSRSPLARSTLGSRESALLDIPRDLLGLSNLATRDMGVEASREDNLRGRERRIALFRLLRDVDPELPFGAELAGMNRRVAHRPLEEMALRAFARRGAASPTPEAIEAARAWAAAEHGRCRRLGVPRTHLARALELFVTLDRARYLEERGYEVSVGALFDADVSARNLAVIARPLS